MSPEAPPKELTALAPAIAPPLTVPAVVVLVNREIVELPLTNVSVFLTKMRYPAGSKLIPELMVRLLYCISLVNVVLTEIVTSPSSPDPYTNNPPKRVFNTIGADATDIS